jgi:hypothetical protein
MAAVTGCHEGMREEGQSSCMRKKCDYVPRRVNMGTEEPFIFEFNINFTSEFIILLFRVLTFLSVSNTH